MRAGSSSRAASAGRRDGTARGSPQTRQGAKKQEELVKNLQQQIYLLELETRFLRGNKSSTAKEAAADIAAIHKVRDVIDLLPAEVDSAVSLVQEYEGRLAKASQDVETSHNELSAEAERSKQLAVQFGETKQAMKAAQEEQLKRVSELDVEISVKDNEIARLTQCIERQKQSINTLQQSMAQLQVNVLKVKGECALAHAKQEKSSAIISDLHSQVATLKQQYANTTSQDDQNAKSQAETLKEAQQEIVRLNTELRQAEMARKHEQELRQRCEVEIKQLLKENTEMSSRASRAESDLTRFQRERSTYNEALTSSSEKYTREIQDLQAGNKLLKRSIEEYEITNALLLDQVREKEYAYARALEELAAERDRFNNESAFLQSLRGEIAQSRFTANKLTEQIRELERVHRETKDQLERKDEALADLRQKYQRLNTELRQTEIARKHELELRQRCEVEIKQLFPVNPPSLK